MKSPLLSLLLCLFSISCLSQNYSIKGIVTDTLDVTLISSTVLLLEQSDSTMVDFTRTELDGSFKFEQVTPGAYIVKTTYIGYIPKTVNVPAVNKEDIDVGIIKMVELAEELMTVVIKAAKAPIKMRGDTIEYDATTFKVPEGSTVEDLLKRLPGIEVESDGSIMADGKDVNTVTVDGKAFFGQDPKAATKNLPAEGISKVQVFDTKTEEEEITGATSQSKEKTMNLELKEDFKNGGFGKVIAGMGTESTKELKGNYNRFNKKIQFSLVGVGNNTGRNGLSWNDYQDFMGSQSFNFGGGTDYGFGGDGWRSFTFGGGSGGLESNIQSIFFNNSGNGGLPENYNGGINFNYEHNKTKVSSVYYYNQSGIIRDGNSSRDRFFQEFTTNEEATNLNDNLSRGHRIELEFTKDIDSLHFVKLKTNGAFINENNQAQENTELRKDGVLTSTSDIKNDINTNGYLGNALLLLRKKFKKKGRSLGVNASYLYTELEDNWTQNSVTNFYNNAAEIDSTAIINQLNTNIRNKKQLKANALYVEPLSEKFFWQTFYNFSNREETGDREVNDISGSERLLNEDLSRTYINNIDLDRIGSSLRYSYEGVNITMGLGYQRFDLKGDFKGKGDSPIIGKVDKIFTNWIPHFSLNFEPIRNGYMSFGYSRNATEPSIDDLQPIVNNLNPQYIVIGNPGLTPEINNRFSTSFNHSHPLSGRRINLNASIEFNESQFSTSETVDSFLITTAQPINVSGGRSWDVSGSLNFPIIKNRITTRMRLNVGQNIRPSFVNDLKNNTTSLSYNPYIRVNITPVDAIGIYLTARSSFVNTTYDINTSQNQSTRNDTYSAELTAKTFAGIFLNANFNYQKFKNNRFNVDRSIPILNLSIYKQILKGNRGEIRVSLYDAFNKNVGFTSSDTYRSETQSLARYVMLSFTYNIRGIQSSAHKKSWW